MAKKKKDKAMFKIKNVFFKGFDVVHPDDQKRIKELLYQHYIELERELGQVADIHLHFKKYEKGGREKYSIRLMIDFPGRPIVVDKIYEAARWDAVAAVNVLLKKARQAIINRFKTDATYRKPYY